MKLIDSFRAGLTFNMFKAGGIGNHGILSIKHGLYMAYVLIIWRTFNIIQSVAEVLLSCPNCGNTSVPYPLSTNDGCSQATLVMPIYF
jgi:hypothetical protein